MKIVVCVKQVPSTTQVEVDPVTGVLKRDGVSSKLNPYDLFAVETAVSIKERTPGTVVKAISMGPPQAIPSLLETLYMGTDEAYLLSDRKFAGADVHATSYALKSGVESLGPFDLLVCGKQTTDGDTAQVGPEMAEMLGIEHVTNVLNVDRIEDDGITVTMNLDDCIQTQKMLFPCLITIDKDANTPRLPSYKRKMSIPSDAVKVITAGDLKNLDENRLGLKGSPTQVERIFPPDKNADKQIFQVSAEESAQRILDLLKSKKLV